MAVIRSTVNSLNLIRNDHSEINNLIESAKIFGAKIHIDAESDFNRHHRRRISKRIDDNPQSQVIFDINAFYRHEFIKVLDNLITMLSSNIETCVNNLRPLFNIFKLPWSPENTSLENISDVVNMFPDPDNRPNVYALQSEMEILFDNCKDCENMQQIITRSCQLKCLKLAFKLIQFAITAGYTTASNERKFSLLKLIKNEIRSTMTDDRLCDLMIIKCEKDISDKISLKSAAESWAKLKNRRIRFKSM